MQDDYARFGKLENRAGDNAGESKDYGSELKMLGYNVYLIITLDLKISHEDILRCKVILEERKKKRQIEQNKNICISTKKKNKYLNNQ